MNVSVSAMRGNPPLLLIDGFLVALLRYLCNWRFPVNEFGFRIWLHKS